MINNPEALGLTDKEAKLYLALISLGGADAAKLIAETHYKRPTVYKSLYALVEKGLVQEQRRLGKSFFVPNSPQVVLQVAESRYQELDRARNDFASILPDLLSQYALSTEKPVVSTYQGVKGLKKIYQDMLNTGKPIQAVLYTGDVEPELFKWLTGEFSRERVKKEILVRSVVSSGGWAEQYERRSHAELRETRLVDSKLYPIKHEIDIYGDKVAIIDFKKGGSLIGIVINHPPIAASMLAWFELTWAQAALR